MQRNQIFYYYISYWWYFRSNIEIALIWTRSCFIFNSFSSYESLLLRESTMFSLRFNSPKIIISSISSSLSWAMSCDFLFIFFYFSLIRSQWELDRNEALVYNLKVMVWVHLNVCFLHMKMILTEIHVIVVAFSVYLDRSFKVVIS